MIEPDCLKVPFKTVKFLAFIYGRPFTIMTYHYSLCWLESLRIHRGRLARCALSLQDYTFTVAYHSGRKHTDAEVLSRRPLELSNRCAGSAGSDAEHFEDYLASLSTAIPDHATFNREQRRDNRPLSIFKSTYDERGARHF